MQLLIFVLGTVAGLILLALLVALCIPRHYTVRVSGRINRPPHVVREYIRFLKNQEEYNEWLKAVPPLNVEITGIDGTVGAIQRWHGDNKGLGIGEQEIKLIADDRIETELRFKTPIEGTCRLVNSFTAEGEAQTILCIDFYAYSRYPSNLMASTIGRRIIKAAQRKNMEHIRRILEAQR